MKCVKAVNLDQRYLIGQNIDQVTFWDNFQLSSEKLVPTIQPKDLMIAFFKSFPKSFIILLRIREFLAKKLRLKTAPETDAATRLERLHQFKGEIGECIAIFEVLDKTEQELLTGQNDAHLDFKLSFITYTDQQDVKLELATTVIIHNWLGKAYFTLVKPIHKFYMKRILKRMEKELLNKCW